MALSRGKHIIIRNIDNNDLNQTNKQNTASKDIRSGISFVEQNHLLGTL